MFRKTVSGLILTMLFLSILTLSIDVNSEASVDIIPPKIRIPIQRPPPDNVMPYQSVCVIVNVTDAESGVKNVTLQYSINGGATWYVVIMNYNAFTGLYQAVIPGYPACTSVAYMIIAYDNAENVAIQDNNGYYYTYHVKQRPSISLTVDINPETLNLRSRGKWITAYIELPEGYSVDDINASSILLNETISVDLEALIEIGNHDNDTIPDLMVNFNLTDVADYILSEGIVYGNVTLTVSGKLYDGTSFSGSDVILVSSLLGDMNVDGKIDGQDLILVAYSFGTFPGHPRYNSMVDVNNDNIVDGLDLIIICKNFGKACK